VVRHAGFTGINKVCPIAFIGCRLLLTLSRAMEEQGAYSRHPQPRATCVSTRRRRAEELLGPYSLHARVAPGSKAHSCGMLEAPLLRKARSRARFSSSHIFGELLRAAENRDASPIGSSQSQDPRGQSRKKQASLSGWEQSPQRYGGEESANWQGGISFGQWLGRRESGCVRARNGLLPTTVPPRCLQTTPLLRGLQGCG
jgi:hypothetical protein